MEKRLTKVHIIILIIAILFIIVINITPVFHAWLIRLLFAYPNPKLIKEYESRKNEFISIENIYYPSAYKDNILDVYLPKNESGPFPVIIWVHGGAFTGGDKTDMRYYGEALAIDGYAVVSINYRRAPEGKYPVPILQVADAYKWIVSEKNKYNFDIENLIFAGDSSGAQIVSQFVTIQTNIEYSDLTKINQTIPPNHIKCTLLYCGIYDIKSLEEFNKHKILSYFIDKAGWAYLGRKDWKEEFEEELTVTDYITENYPATFITDGNKYSFEKQGKELAEKLKEKDIKVREYYIPIEEMNILHEYQFKMNTEHGEKVYKEVLKFLNELFQK